MKQIPEAARSLGLRVRIPPEAWMSLVSAVCYAGTDRYDGPIPRPYESYRVCVCVCVCVCVAECDLVQQ